MARIAGVEVPDNKKIEIGLTAIYGIGRSSARGIVDVLNIDPSKRVGDLTDVELSRIRSYVTEHYVVEGELRQIIFRNIKRLKDIRCYRGIRHKLGLPVRGQRTRCNAHTRKGRGLAVGGLKRKLEKT